MHCKYKKLKCHVYASWLMNDNILFTIIGALTLLGGSVRSMPLHKMSPKANRTGEYAKGAMNETGEVAGNATEGLGKAVNETGEALSNATGNVLEGIQDVVNGSSQ